MALTLKFHLARPHTGAPLCCNAYGLHRSMPKTVAPWKGQTPSGPRCLPRMMRVTDLLCMRQIICIHPQHIPLLSLLLTPPFLSPPHATPHPPHCSPTSPRNPSAPHCPEAPRFARPVYPLLVVHPSSPPLPPPLISPLLLRAPPGTP